MIQQNKKKVYLYGFLFLIAIILLLIYLIDRGSFGYYYTEQNSTTIKYSPGHSNGSFIVAITSMALFLVFTSSLLVSKKTYFSIAPVQRLNIYFLIFLSVLWSIITVFNEGIRGLLSQTTSSYVYLLVIAVFLGTIDYIWEQVEKWSLIIAVTSIPVAFIYSTIFVVSTGGRIGNSPQIIYLSTGFWPLAIWTLCFEQKSKINKIITLVLLILALLTAIIYVSRGWIIQCLILILCYIYKRNKIAKNKASFFKIIFTFTFLIMIVLFIANKYFPQYIEILIGRLNADTRTWQYKELFTQYSMNDFLFGKGLYATYSSSQYGDYKYIDNTFVYLMFHYGIFFMLSYIGLLIGPILRVIRYKSNYNIKLMCTILIMWILALSGLSVYNVQMIDIKCLFIFILVGRCYKVSTIGSKNYATSIVERGVNIHENL